ncbi:MAG: FliH/SctL family protein [Dissulfuribacterales bacterium]
MSKVIKAAHCENTAAVPVFTALSQDETSGFSTVQHLLSASDVHEMEGAEEMAGAQELPEIKLEQERRRLLEEATAFLEQAKQDAEHMRIEAQNAVEKLIADARVRAAALEREAYEKGFEQGKKDGEALGRKAYEMQAERFGAVIDAMRHKGEELLTSYEPVLIELVLNISKALVRHELNTTPELVHACLERGLAMAVKGMPVRVHLHSKDLELIQRAEMPLSKEAAGHSLEFLADASVERGGCLLETDMGVIDATMATQWRTVSQAILDILRERMAQHTAFENTGQAMMKEEIDH